MDSRELNRREFVRITTTAATAAAAGLSAASGSANPTDRGDPTKTRSYNENMEYRRLGRTNLWLSAIGLGGHWKKIPYEYNTPEFKKNRREVIAACLDHGINYVDACWDHEVIAYGEAIKGRRDEIYFGYSFGAHESRFPEWGGSLQKMKEGFEMGLKAGGLDYVDLWRITMHEQTSRSNTEKEIEIAMEALGWAKRTGKARFTGVSSHDRNWITEAVAKYPQLEVIVTPYTAGSKRAPQGSMFEAFEKYDVGFIGIKPFASGAVFKSRGMPDSSTKEEDDRRARLVLRYVLSCPQLTTAIPGLITVDQVKNAALAIIERRKEDLLASEQAEIQEIADHMWKNLPHDYAWLRQWEWV
ncbi:aldo/keto reductase [Thermogutta sp.]|uniref:aldo/keto reductase n=1 Tax=Thermogutta sp. TaxID=1962930 RepID=UPI00321FA354